MNFTQTEFGGLKKNMAESFLILIKRYSYFFPHRLEIKFDLFMCDNIFVEKYCIK
jgi:hypothetical protein